MKKKILFATVLLAFGMSACGKTEVQEVSTITPEPTTVSAEPTQAEDVQVDTEAEKAEAVPVETEEHVRTPEQEHIAEMLYSKIPTSQYVYMTITYDGVEYPVCVDHSFWDEENNFLFISYTKQHTDEKSIGYIKYGDKEYFGCNDWTWDSTDPNAPTYNTVVDFETGETVEFSYRYISAETGSLDEYRYIFNGEEHVIYTESVRGHINPIEILKEKGIKMSYDEDACFGEQQTSATASASASATAN